MCVFGVGLQTALDGGWRPTDLETYFCWLGILSDLAFCRNHFLLQYSKTPKNYIQTSIGNYIRSIQVIQKIEDVQNM